MRRLSHILVYTSQNVTLLKIPFLSSIYFAVIFNDSGGRYGNVSTKIFDTRHLFDFEIINFPFLDVDVPRSTSYGAYMSHLIRFDRESSHDAYFNTRNKLLTQKLLKIGYRHDTLRKTFSLFYRRYYNLIYKIQVGLFEREFYGDLVIG